MKTTQKLLVRSVLAGIAGSLSYAPINAVGAALDEVVVTARKKEENVQSVPVSVTAITGATVDSAMPKDLRDMAGMAPNVIIDDASSGPGSPASISMRGLSFQDVEKSFEPAVGVVIDGIFIGSNTGQMLQVIDVERLEILRGPQGTLFGKNAIGGVINVVRTQPTFDLTGKVRARLGNYNLRSYDGTVSNGLTDKLAAKLTFSKKTQDGYFTNEYDGKNVGKLDYTAATLGFLFNATDNLTLNYTLDGSWDRSDSPPLANMAQPGTLWCDALGQCAQSTRTPQTGSRYRINQDGPTDSFMDSIAHTLHAEWTLNDNLTAEYIFGYRKEKEGIVLGVDAVPMMLFQPHRDQKFHQMSNELRFAYEPSSDFSATVGLYQWSSAYKIRQITDLFFVPGATTQYTKQTDDSLALFGEADYTFLDDFTLTLGGRFTRERKEAGNHFLAGSATSFIDNLDDPVDKTWNKFSPKISLAWQATPDMLGYATYSTGFRSGGFNGRPGSFNSATLPYNPETVESVEVGTKTSWLNNALQFNLAYFQTAYDDKQEEVNQLSSTGVGGQETVVFNAASATIQGVEVELAARPMDGLTLRANAGWLEANYDTFVDPLGVDRSDQRLRRTPTFTGTFAGTYEWDMLAGQMAVNTSYHFIGDYATDFGDTVETRDAAQRLLDASISYAVADVRVSFYGSNLLNSNEWQHAYNVAGLWTFAAPRAPRTYGVEVTYSFGK